ncbi:MAG: S8 family serine peptidase, partial [Candidatus Aenigmarchaeota archaeon]|nr:S8 family serine peptidase [Candidatus Aenigmarchaeota archaeon]
MLEDIDKQGYAKVIVKLKDDYSGVSNLGMQSKSTGKFAAKKAMVKKQQENVLSTLKKGRVGMQSDIDFELKREYAIYNGFSGKITSSGLEELIKNENVETIYYDYPVHATLNVSVPLINANDVWQQKINGINATGGGETVCVIDTGINYNHSDFGGANGFPSNKVIGGYDYSNNDAYPWDDHGHGSHCAGIIASQDSTYKGAAPDAKIVAIKVLDSQGGGWDSDVIAGIEWCTNNASEYNISVISMSLGVNISVYHTMPCDQDAMADSINNAVAANITVVISSGNDGMGQGTYQGISTPACVSNAISVGATNDADAIAGFTNRALILDILAPGVNIMSTKHTGTHVNMDGTSMAAPHVAGVAALLQQVSKLKYNRTLTPNEVRNKLKYNGASIKDTSGTNLTFTRVDALDAVDAKGIVPMGSGEPFYTTTQNPSNSFDLADNKTHNMTWEVNATGDLDTYKFFVIFEDSAMDNNVTDNIYITINDTISPTINFTNPTTQTGNYSQNWISANATAGDANLAKVTIYLYNSTYNLINSTNSSSSPRFINFTNLQDGTYYLNATANDTAGNTNHTGTKTVILDMTGPVVNLESPGNNTNENLTRAITFKYNVSDETLNVSNCSLYINSNLNETSNSIIEGVTQSFTAKKLDNGYYNWSIKCRDTADNLGESSIYYLNMSVTAPTVNLENPIDNYNSSENNVAFNCSASDNSGLVNITLYIWNSTQEICAANTTNISGISNSTTWTVNLTHDGNYTWNCLAYDDSNLSDFGINRTLTIDTIYPAFSGYARNLNPPNEDEDVQVNVTITETNIHTVILEWNGTTNYTVANHTGAEYYFTINQGNYTAHDFVTYYWYANDSAGNSNKSEPQNFTVGNQIPTVSALTINNTNPYTDDIISCDNGTFSDEDGDSEGGRQFKWYNNSAEINGETSQTLNLSISGLDKTNVLICSIRVNDSYNWSNWVNSTNNATIQNSAPTITTTQTNVSRNANGTTWTYYYNATDADNDTLTWSTNSTLFDINSSIGIINDTPIESEAGEYSINITVSDGTANTVDIFIYQIKDVTNPSVTINQPTETIYNSTYVILNTTVTDGKEVGVCQYSLDNWTTNIPYNCTNTSVTMTCLESSNTVRVRANDTSGNLNNTESITFTVDTTNPAIEYNSSTTQEGTHSQTYIEANVTASDDNLANVTIYLYNSTDLLYNYTNSTGFFYNFTNLDDGTYYLNATANDTAGNTNWTETRTITLNTAPPTITIHEP